MESENLRGIRFEELPLVNAEYGKGPAAVMGALPPELLALLRADPEVRLRVIERLERDGSGA